MTIDPTEMMLWIGGLVTAIVALVRIIERLVPNRVEKALAKALERFEDVLEKEQLRLGKVEDQVDDLHDAHLGTAARTPDGGLKWWGGEKLDAILEVQREILAELKAQTSKIDIGEKMAGAQETIASALAKMAEAFERQSQKEVSN